MDPAEALALGRKMGAKVCPHGQWSEDVQAAAALGAWLARPGCEAIAAKRAAIDELRRLTGWDRRRGSAPAPLSLGHALSVAVEDPDPFDSPDPVPDPTADLDERDAGIVWRLAGGMTPTAIGRELGMPRTSVNARRVAIRARVRRSLTTEPRTGSVPG